MGWIEKRNIKLNMIQMIHFYAMIVMNLYIDLILFKKYIIYKGYQKVKIIDKIIHEDCAAEYVCIIKRINGFKP